MEPGALFSTIVRGGKYRSRTGASFWSIKLIVIAFSVNKPEPTVSITRTVNTKEAVLSKSNNSFSTVICPLMGWILKRLSTLPPTIRYRSMPQFPASMSFETTGTPTFVSCKLFSSTTNHCALMVGYSLTSVSWIRTVQTSVKLPSPLSCACTESTHSWRVSKSNVLALLT